MHELSLLENVREILQEQARQHKFNRVKQITLEIGKLSSVEPDALHFAFDVVMKNTLADQAELVIRFSEGVGVCRRCQQRVQMETLHDPCYRCGHPRVDVIEGGAMKISDLLVV